MTYLESQTLSMEFEVVADTMTQVINLVESFFFLVNPACPDKVVNIELYEEIEFDATGEVAKAVPLTDSILLIQDGILSLDISSPMEATTFYVGGLRYGELFPAP